MPTTWPPTNQNRDQLKKRAENWTIILDLDGTLGYSLIPQSRAEKKALGFILEWRRQCLDVEDQSDLNLDHLIQQYRQTKAKIYRELTVLPKRHDKRLRFQRLLRELCQKESTECSETCLDQTMTCYWKTFEKEATVFEDTYDSLQCLRKDFLLIILTNNCWDEALRKLHVFGLEQGIHFDLIVTSECIGYCKDAEGFFEHLQEYVHSNFNINIIPDRLVIVGDEPSDIAFANRAGSVSVRIKQDLLAETEPENPLEEPNHTINTLSELIPIMKNHLSSQNH